MGFGGALLRGAGMIGTGVAVGTVMTASLILDATYFIRPLATARRALRSFATFARGMLRTVLNPLTLAFGGMGAALPIVQFESLNRAMAKSTAIMGNVSDRMMGTMRQAAIDVSKTTEFTASTVAESYRAMASAGFNAEQSVAMLPITAQFAQAGMFDMAQSVNYLADTQKALGMESDNASENMRNQTRIADVLTKANILANGEVQDFAEALQNKVGGALRQTNKDIEEGVAVLAAFADQGIKGQSAGTALNIVLRDLQTQAIKNKEAFKAAGVEVFNASGEMNNMADILQDLEQRLEGLSPERRKIQMKGLGFQDRSVQFIQTLIGTSDRIREYEEQLWNAGGTTKEVADKMMTPMQKAVAGLRGELQQLSESAAPVVDLITSLVNGLTIIAKGSLVKNVGSGLSQMFIEFIKRTADQIQILLGAIYSLIAEIRNVFFNFRNGPLGVKMGIDQSPEEIRQEGGEIGEMRRNARNLRNQAPWSQFIDQAVTAGANARAVGQAKSFFTDTVGPAIGKGIADMWNTHKPWTMQKPGPAQETPPDWGGLWENVQKIATERLIPAADQWMQSLDFTGRRAQLMKQLQSPDTMEFVKSGSAASFSQRAAIRGGDSKDRIQKEILEMDKKQEQHLKAMRRALENPALFQHLKPSGL